MRFIYPYMQDHPLQVEVIFHFHGSSLWFPIFFVYKLNETNIKWMNISFYFKDVGKKHNSDKVSDIHLKKGIQILSSNLKLQWSHFLANSYLNQVEIVKVLIYVRGLLSPYVYTWIFPLWITTHTFPQKQILLKTI